MRRIHDYRHIVGDKVISQIYHKASKLYDKRVIHVNSTYAGGGVAEILNSLAPLMNDAGVDADWRILRGTPDLFNITKKFHNALQGDKIHLTSIKKKLYLQANEDFSTYALLDHDCVFIHDPQPLPLVEYCRKKQPWIWRCHIDLSTPNKELWEFLKGYILRYDKMIVSSEKYKKDDLPIEQVVFQPVIDPLTPKNMELSDKDIAKYLKKFGVPTDKPLITQISRFDKWKDPQGVLDIFKTVKKQIDCRLVLCGSMASDDPEGMQIFEKIKYRSNHLVENGDVILITSENNILVNALQRSSAVILQKSLREGFGLTVTEALWKGTPVIASNVGGIPLQIEHEKTGYLFDPQDKSAFAEKIIEILENPKHAKELALAGKEYVRKHFLITRLLEDHFDMLINVFK